MYKKDWRKPVFFIILNIIMAKLLQPLLSMTASGIYAKKLLFINQKNGSVVLSLPKYSRNRKINPSTRQIQIRENFIKAKIFFSFATNEEINYFRDTGRFLENNKNAEIMGEHIKKRPVYLGLNFIGDNTIGSITN